MLRVIAIYIVYNSNQQNQPKAVLRYISIKILKEHTDLEKNLYIPKKLESTFVELIIKVKKNIIIGCIYKYPKLDINEFNTLFENTMEKFSFENKELYLLGDFNIDLLKTDDDANIDEFYNIISSNFLVPHITLPTRITSTSI